MPNLKHLSDFKRYLPTKEVLRQYLPAYLLPRQGRAHQVGAEPQRALTAEDVLGVARLDGGFLWLKDGSMAKVLVVQPINLDLRTQHERDKILNGEKELLTPFPSPYSA